MRPPEAPLLVGVVEHLVNVFPRKNIVTDISIVAVERTKRDVQVYRAAWINSGVRMVQNVLMLQ